MVPKIEPSAFECVLYDVTDHVATLTLNRPERRNVLNRAGHATLIVIALGRIRDFLEVGLCRLFLISSRC